MPTFFHNSGPLSKGSRFVIISIVDPDRNFTDMNKKEINQSIMGLLGTVKYIGRLRNGSLLVETINKVQAIKLCSMTKINHTTCISVIQHDSLNISKGVDTCFELGEYNRCRDVYSQQCLENVST
jgi:hypothetical protein